MLIVISDPDEFDQQTYAGYIKKLNHALCLASSQFNISTDMYFFICLQVYFPSDGNPVSPDEFQKIRCI
jgi:hypothetical protein